MSADHEVIILAGGKGEGLRPLSIERPKTLLPICNWSILGRITAQLNDSGMSKALLWLGAATKQHVDQAKSLSPAGFELVVKVSTDIYAGSALAVDALASKKASSILVIYGDSLLSMDFRLLMEAHAAFRCRGGQATIAYHRPPDLRNADADGRTYHGVMSVDETAQVTRFEEKPLVASIHSGFDLANAAVFICQRKFLSEFTQGGAKDFSRHVFEKAVNCANKTVFGFDLANGFRRDVGTVDRFFDLNMTVLRRELPVPIPAEATGAQIWSNTPLSGNTSLSPPLCVGSGVRISQGAIIGPDVVIGNNCVIGRNAVVRRSVLLEGCSIGAEAHLEQVILAPCCRIADKVTLPPHTVLGAGSQIGGRDWPTAKKTTSI